LLNHFQSCIPFLLSRFHPFAFSSPPIQKRSVEKWEWESDGAGFSCLVFRPRGDLSLSVHRHGAGLAVAHVSALKDILSVLMLVQKEVIVSLLH
jgi:hypothetical protein